MTQSIYDKLAYEICDAIPASGCVGQPLIDAVSARLKAEFGPLLQAGVVCAKALSDDAMSWRTAKEQSAAVQLLSAKDRIQ